MPAVYRPASLSHRAGRARLLTTNLRVTAGMARPMVTLLLEDGGQRSGPG